MCVKSQKSQFTDFKISLLFSDRCKLNETEKIWVHDFLSSQFDENCWITESSTPLNMKSTVLLQKKLFDLHNRLVNFTVVLINYALTSSELK